MPLIASISGIRGVFGDGLDPDVIVRYAAAFGAWCRQQSRGGKPLVVVGRDGRTTGAVCARLVTATLQAAGCDVVDAGLATTPTVAMGVLEARAAGAVILSASHNPAEWNALKLLDGRSEFLGPAEAEAVIAMANEAPGAYTVAHGAIGDYREADFLGVHVRRILDLPYIDPEAIRARGFRVVVDGINSVGAFALPALLRALGVAEVEVLNAEVTGRFAHNPEPLPQHLGGLMERVRTSGADLGLAVDPDADRLALVTDGGGWLGEELTQVVAADFLLRKKPGPFATNLSSSRAVDDVAARYGQAVHRSAVGEIHVVRKMQEVGAVLGGEGNGGVILPDLHYGRDALAGAALVLMHLAETGLSLSEVQAGLPVYHLAKHRLDLTEGLDADRLLAALAARYAGERVSTVDGVKIDLDEGWVHLRKSNTEPIIRVYTEAPTPEAADALAERFKQELLTTA
ncbi:MAG TPA: phosphoglucosamine mutase [Rubricoccaceae bacterium]|nr:phosphoglucosamine mutase [Rubricoccaceae bacterium]